MHDSYLPRSIDLILLPPFTRIINKIPRGILLVLRHTILYSCSSFIKGGISFLLCFADNNFNTSRFLDRKTTILSQIIFSFKNKEKNIIFCLCHKNLVSFFFSSFNAVLCDCVSIWTVWLGPRLLYHLSSQHKKSKRCLDLPESSLPR